MIYTLTLNPAIDREYTIEVFLYDDVIRARDSRTDWGGKGFNVSRALAELGAESTALGFVGGGAGKMLEDGLKSIGINVNFVHIAEETRTNTSIITANHGHYLKVNESGPTITAGETDALMEKIRWLVVEGDWWVLGGSLPPGLHADTYARLVKLIQSGGGRVILDASGESLRLGCAAAPALIKPNQTEAAELTGVEPDGDSDFSALIKEMQALGAKDILLSLGVEGAVYATGDTITRAAPPAITPRNPIGSGDSMVAGTVYALSQGFPPEDVLRWGIACGAAAASMAGTGVGPRGEVERLLKKVTIL